MINTLRIHRASQTTRARRAQMAVAKACRMSQWRFWMLENDKSDPTARELKALSRYFGVAPEVLFPPLATSQTHTPKKETVSA